MRRLAQFVVRRRRWVVGAWILLAAALAPSAARLERVLEVAATVRGGEAAAVQQTLQADFASPFARFAVAVLTGIAHPDSAPGRAALTRVMAAIDSTPGVTSTLSYLTAGDSLFLGAPPATDATFIIVGLDAHRTRLDDLVPVLRGHTRPVVDSLRRIDAAATIRWTGEVPINYDIRRTSALDARRAEQRVLPLTVVLLLLAFGAVVAMLLPILTASLAIVVSLGVTVWINELWPLSVLVQNIVSMIGLGVGIDYALLTVSRFREARAAGRSADEAAVEASHHAGVTIALSGAAVMIGFGALLFVPLNELQSVGVGGIVVVGVSVLMAVTLLPAVLAWLGPRVDAGRLGRRRTASTPMEHVWRRWGAWVVAHPWLALVAGAVPVLLLAAQAPRLNPALPRGNWLPPGMESAVALEDLARMQRDGVVNTIRVVLELPPGASPLEEPGWQATRRLTAAVAADPRVARVQSLTTVLPLEHVNPMLLSFLPAEVQRTMIARRGRATALDVLPREGVEFNALTALARDLRRMEVARVTGLSGARIAVGGLPAFNADYADAINARARSLVAAVVGLTLVALMIGFRSVLVPVKALVLNLLSVAAAYGAVVLVFQEGHGAALVGLSAPMHAVFPAMPILVFCIVFGLSMDYEVFLVARVAEARRHMGEDAAIVEGLARTGGVITSAAAIMIAVFGAFTLGDFLFIKVLGFALAVAVLLDATLVRMAVGPALLALAGRWNWWPGRR